MPKHPACGTGPALPGKDRHPRSITDMNDAGYRADALTRALLGLAMPHGDLMDAGAPPIISLLFMLKDEIEALSNDLSELEHMANRGKVTICQ